MGCKCIDIDDDVWMMIGIADVGRTTAKLNWDWAVHVSNWRTSPLLPEDERRRRVTARWRWRDDLERYEKAWWEIAKDREHWKILDFVSYHYLHQNRLKWFFKISVKKIVMFYASEYLFQLSCLLETVLFRDLSRCVRHEILNKAINLESTAVNVLACNARFK